MAGAPKRDRKPMGIWLDPPAHLEAQRIASVAGLNKSQVIRLAIEAGLPLIAARLAPPERPYDPGDDADVEQ